MNPRLGIIGGGQLGRMTAMEAARLGFEVHCFDPSENCPASQVCSQHTQAAFDDMSAMEAFARSVDFMTLEFENIPAAAIQLASQHTCVRPAWNALHICQNREREKNFLKSIDVPHAPYAVVSSVDELTQALEKIGVPAVLKTADFGYDGKGQSKITHPNQASEAWKLLNAPRAVLEGWVNFSMEISVICARNGHGEIKTFPVAENKHTHHILDLSIVPARISDVCACKAKELATKITEALEVCGLLAVEMFLTKEGEIIVNELAPRPHNSGHYTLDACYTSQFEQLVRCATDLPLGAPDLKTPIVMVNLLGNCWEKGSPHWETILSHPLAKLHLYGKEEARPGRKMGHFCVMGNDVNSLVETATSIQSQLLS